MKIEHVVVALVQEDRVYALATCHSGEELHFDFQIRTGPEGQI
jgi:hypothetical protein